MTLTEAGAEASIRSIDAMFAIDERELSSLRQEEEKWNLLVLH
jgi:hypothetical protein